MTISDTDVRLVVESLGFRHAMTGSFVPMEFYAKQLSGAWLVEVVVHDGQAVFSLVERVGGSSYGPKHRFHSAAALARSAGSAVTAIEQASQDLSTWSCPKCGGLTVVKEGVGASWPPFLSCTGMQVVRGSYEGVRTKGIACNGKRNSPKAIVEHF